MEAYQAWSPAACSAAPGEPATLWVVAKRLLSTGLGGARCGAYLVYRETRRTHDPATPVDRIDRGTPPKFAFVHARLRG